jgi:hypothetical protein
MRIGGSLFLIAVGAILTFAVNVNNSHGFNINDAGIILMVVGAIGVVITGIWMASNRRTLVARDGAAGPVQQTTVREPNDPAAGRY